jgi:hypothetical protein
MMCHDLGSHGHAFRYGIAIFQVAKQKHCAEIVMGTRGLGTLDGNLK